MIGRVSVDLARLVQAILCRVKEQRGSVTKTKLLKYLYLFDIASYRLTGTTITGFSWIFHRFGPWTVEFEKQYVTWQGVAIDVKNVGDAQVVWSLEPVEMGQAVSSPDLEREFRRIVDEWADASLGRMLDHVYFETEPMRAAERGNALDFFNVKTATEPVIRRLPQRTIDAKLLRSLREKISASRKLIADTSTPLTPAPIYDDAYWLARAATDDE